tara:strand:+ start:251 stop:439 length:189 start_codon:yes stop_codon:yes gene_type:complete
MKYFFLLIFLFFLISCGYPDIDNVPDFKDVNLSEEEINDYCSTTNSDKKKVDNCINNFISKN